MTTDLKRTDGGLYQHLLTSISDAYLQGRSAAFKAVNVQLLQTYWQIGKHIVEFEQKGSLKASYSERLLSTISKDLSLQHGKGFSLSNLKRMRQYFIH